MSAMSCHVRMGQHDRSDLFVSCNLSPFRTRRRSAVTDTTSPPTALHHRLGRGARVRQWLIPCEKLRMLMFPQNTQHKDASHAQARIDLNLSRGTYRLTWCRRFRTRQCPQLSPHGLGNRRRCTCCRGSLCTQENWLQPYRSA
jgi:hypothetical protein